MCIICNNDELGSEYLSNMSKAVKSLKNCEKILLQLSNVENIHYDKSLERAKNYNKAHKLLVKIRRRLNDVEKTRELK